MVFKRKPPEYYASPDKRCTCCGETKPKTDFCRNNCGRGDGYQSQCKACKASNAKQHRAAMRENIARSTRGDHRVGSQRPNAKLTESDIPLIRALRAAKVPAKTVAGKFEVSEATVRRIDRQEIWTHVA